MSFNQIQKVLSDGTLKVNDKRIYYKGDVTITIGAENKVSGLVGGAGVRGVAVSSDTTTNVDSIKFMIPANSENKDISNSWKNNLINNTVVYEDNTVGKVVFRLISATLTNRIESTFGSEGEIEIIFEGI